jgi:hypothetical protein
MCVMRRPNESLFFTRVAYLDDKHELWPKT